MIGASRRSRAILSSVRCQASEAAPSFKSMPAAAAAAAPPAAPAATAPAVAAPTFKEVKFVKEDVNAVMEELPAFTFYEMNEPVPNPYRMNTLDHDILLNPVEPSLVKGSVEYSQLENGLKVASIDRQGLNASVGLYVNTGSRNEDASNFGVSHMAALMGFKSTAHLSHLRTAKVLEHLGCNQTAKATAGREDIAYTVNVMREYVPLVVPMLVGNVLFPRLLPWEVKAAHAGVAAAAASQTPDDVVNEMLHATAYCNNSLGYSPLASSRSMSYFTPETIRSYMLDHFSPENMVLVGVNCEHDDLAKWAMRSFVDYNAIPHKSRSVAKAAYTGGTAITKGDSPFCHFAVGLETGGWGESSAPVSVLTSLLGGSSASHQVPGAGLTSRLGQIVSQNPGAESVSAFNTSYSDTGLVGVYGVTAPDAAGDVVTAVAGALKGAASVTEGELAKAKAALKGNLLRQADDSAAVMKDIGSQILLSGKYIGASEFCGHIDAVTAADVSAAAQAALSSAPTVVAYGDTHAMPHSSAVAAALK